MYIVDKNIEKKWYIIEAELEWGYDSRTSMHRTWKSSTRRKNPVTMGHMFYDFYGQSRIWECTGINVLQLEPTTSLSRDQRDYWK